MSRESFYEGFDFFMGILILIFVLWESEYSRFVIIACSALICIVSIVGIFFSRDIANSKMSDFEDENHGHFGIESPESIEETLKKAKMLSKK